MKSHEYEECGHTCMSIPRPGVRLCPYGSRINGNALRPVETSL